MNIFDSLAHPTMTGEWVSKNLDASFQTLQDQMRETSVKWACAVGLDNVQAYSHDAYFKASRRYDNLFPVAGFNPRCNNIREELLQIKKIGYYGIKIHPRFSKIRLTDPCFDKAFKLCALLGLPVFLCTYFYGKSVDMGHNSFETLSVLLNKNPETKVVLVHGGAVDVLRFMELVRFNDNLLLDLSLTILKYKGSSIDLDLKFLFENFDRRICIGTDHPEYSPDDLEKRFIQFSEGLTNEKKENIAFRNITTFLGIVV